MYIWNKLNKFPKCVEPAHRQGVHRGRDNLKEMTMSKGKVLIIGSNATRIETKDGRTGTTGQYLNETVVPAMALIAAGYDVVLAGG